MFEVIFDVETKKWFDETGDFDPSKLGVSIVSVYFRELDTSFQEIKGVLKSFWEKDFAKMWPIFLEADRIIGFNSVHFDVPALKPYAPSQWPKLPHFDILDKVKDESGHKVSLNKIARDTLGEAKTDDPAKASLYFAKGDPQSLTRLQSYCEADVLLTKKVYDFGREKGFLKFTDFWNNPRTVPVNFSYPKDFSPPAKQGSLF